jgi:hypothetical protein
MMKLHPANNWLNHEHECTVSDLFQRLMGINQEAFACEEYDVAYHALAAALHCAQSLKDEQRLGDVGRAANEQLAWIDSYHPEYRYSTQSSSRRGNLNVYSNIVRQAKAIGLIIEREAKRQHGK